MDAALVAAVPHEAAVDKGGDIDVAPVAVMPQEAGVDMDIVPVAVMPQEAGTDKGLAPS